MSWLRGLLELGRATGAVSAAEAVADIGRAAALIGKTIRLRKAIAFGEVVDTTIYERWMRGLGEAEAAARAGRYEDGVRLLRMIEQEIGPTRRLEASAGRFAANGKTVLGGQTASAAAKAEGVFQDGFVSSQIGQVVENSQGLPQRIIDLRDLRYNSGAARFRIGWGIKSEEIPSATYRLPSVAQEHATVTIRLNPETLQREVQIIDYSGSGTTLFREGNPVGHTATGGTLQHTLTIPLEPGTTKITIMAGDSDTVIYLSDETQLLEQTITFNRPSLPTVMTTPPRQLDDIGGRAGTTVRFPQEEVPTHAMPVDEAGNAHGGGRVKFGPHVPVDTGGRLLSPFQRWLKGLGGK